MQFTVSLTAPSTQTVTVEWETADGTATLADNDYQSAGGTVIFNPGETSKTVTVQVVGDTHVEPDETFTVTLYNPVNAFLVPGQSTATGTITNDDNLPPAFLPDGDCGCGDGHDAIGTAPGADGGGGEGGFSEAPVRYADGTLRLMTTDLSSDGFGANWGQTRSWSNGRGYSSIHFADPNTVITQWPYLLQDPNSSTIVAISNGDTARYFDQDPVTGAYTERYYLQDSLTYDQTANEYVLTDSTGQQLLFGGTAITPTSQTAYYPFHSLTDAAGNVTRVTSQAGTTGQIYEVQRSSTVNGTTTTESLLYSYNGQNLLSSVILRRQVNGGAWTTVREADYLYYAQNDPYGTFQALKTATIKDGSGNILETKYYRYYTDSVYGGLLHFAFDGPAYARLQAAFADPTTATDDQVAPYADYAFTYDDHLRVTKETAAGQGTFQYAYATSANNPGFNSWTNATTETLPDGSTDVVYTNYAGEVMLSAFTAAGGATDITFHKFDNAGRDILTAYPSAVTGYNPSYADLLNNVNGNYQYLSDTQGRIDLIDYGQATTATATTAGDVAGYIKDHKVQQGELGTPILLDGTQYFAQTANGITIYPTATDTQYRNTDGTGAETTSYSYTWFPNSVQMQSETVSMPVIAAGQNGPGTADTETMNFDNYGRPVSQTDGDGYVDTTAYDQATGAATQTATDVNGLNLVTQDTVDSLGRTTKEVSPGGSVTYTVYDDVNNAVRTYPGWNSATNTPTGPTQVSRDDQANAYTETLTMSAAPHLTGGVPDGTEAVSGIQSLSRTYVNSAGQVIYTDDYFNLTGLTYSTAPNIGTAGVNFYRTLFGYDASGRQNRVQSPTGTITRTVYDGFGHVLSSWVGTNDTGATDTDPTGAHAAGNNMIQVSGNVYDNGGAGDGNLTQTTDYPGGSAANRVTQNYFDWRDRLVASKQGVQANENDGTHRPITYSTLDNLGEATAVAQYDGDGVSITYSNGVPQAPVAGLLRAYSTTAYDDQGRPYQAITYSVDPTTGGVSATGLATSYYYDHRGDLVATSAPGGQWTKQQFDGAGRVTVTYTTDGAGGTAWSAAITAANDTVLQQQEQQYDADGNVIETIDRQRFDSATGTGPLGSPTSGIGARVYYTASYYDNADRDIADVNVGTNGGTAWTRPGTVPAGSDTVLVTSYGYAADEVQQVALTGSPTGGTFTLSFNGQTTGPIAYNASAATVQSALQALSTIGSGNALVAGGAGGPWAVRFVGSLGGMVVATLTGNGSGLTGGTNPSVSVSIAAQGGDAGRQQTVTDPRGISSKTDYDLLGRTVRQISAYANFAPSNTSDQTTEFTYDGSGHQLSVQADEPAGAFQQTLYVYGVTTATGSAIDSNDILAATEYPDPNTGIASAAQKESYTVDALGEQLTKTDRDGNAHTFSYDVLGRQTADAVTTLGAGVDGSVRRIETAYNTQDLPYLYTSYDAAAGGNIVNQVEDVYNGLGQLTTEYQSHSGAVNTSTTPKVQYGYTLMAGGANNSRLVSMTYPNGRVINYNYNTGLDSNISRLSSISDTTGVLEAYTYLGLDTVVKRAHPQPGVDLTYLKQTGEANGDAGDQYTGLDRFGRVVDQRWIVSASGAATDRFQYGYDRDGNRLYQNNLVNAADSELYHANGAANGYDQFNQLTAFARGTLSDSNGDGVPDAIASPTASESWALDSLENWSSFTSNGTTQTRTANQQNEITSISGQTTPAYDANGNMTTDQNGHTLLYDAWNRLVQVKSGSTVLVSYAYDALHRRIIENPGTARDLFFSQQWQVIEERVGGTPQDQYIWSPVYVDAMVERDRDTNGDGTLDERLYAQQDANWNVTAVVSTAGAVQERYIEDPYGNVSVLAPDWSARVQSLFAWIYLRQGGRYDSAAGLYAFRNRDYSPSLGRWAELDPLGFHAGDSNLYAYLSSCPTVWVDPSGLAIQGFQDPRWETALSMIAAAIRAAGRAVFDAVHTSYSFRAIITSSGGNPSANLQPAEVAIFAEEDARENLGGVMVRNPNVFAGGQIWEIGDADIRHDVDLAATRSDQINDELRTSGSRVTRGLIAFGPFGTARDPISGDTLHWWWENFSLIHYEWRKKDDDRDRPPVTIIPPLPRGRQIPPSRVPVPAPRRVPRQPRRVPLPTNDTRICHPEVWPALQPKKPIRIDLP